MPIGGKLVLKGGEALVGVEKKKKKKKKHSKHSEADPAPEGEQAATDGTGPSGVPAAAPKANPLAVSVQSGKTYEAEFDLETKRMQAPKTKSTPWGSSFRAAPEILHGYTSKVKGDTASERLDMRAATKADKFCK